MHLLVFFGPIFFKIDLVYDNGECGSENMAGRYSEKDDIVVPRQSPYFTFFDTVAGSDKRVVPWNEQPMYVH